MSRKRVKLLVVSLVCYFVLFGLLGYSIQLLLGLATLAFSIAILHKNRIKHPKIWKLYARLMCIAPVALFALTVFFGHPNTKILGAFILTSYYVLSFILVPKFVKQLIEDSDLGFKQKY